MKKKILITGGPVHANLDAVKILTNKFRGGTIAALASELPWYTPCEITYLTAKGSTLPDFATIGPNAGHEIVYHNGYDDYRAKVLKYAETYDVVILGAAVCNLIPAKPWAGKFPSHEYEEGQEINIPFLITPRVINMVKKVNPKITLIGFKLLSGVSDEVLIDAAKETLLGSKADCVIANDATNLKRKLVLCKDFSVHEKQALFSVDKKGKAESGGEVVTYLKNGVFSIDSDLGFITKVIEDKHYSSEEDRQTRRWDAEEIALLDSRLQTLKDIANAYKKHFVPRENGLIFGCIAVRITSGSDSFYTTQRGKKDMNSTTIVYDVDHDKRKVYYKVGNKPTLNAPLLHWIFKTNPLIRTITHIHVPFGEEVAGVDWSKVEAVEWAPPGTVRDSERAISKDFYIKNHGLFILE